MCTRMFLSPGRQSVAYPLDVDGLRGTFFLAYDALLVRPPRCQREVSLYTPPPGRVKTPAWCSRGRSAAVGWTMRAAGGCRWRDVCHCYVITTLTTGELRKRNHEYCIRRIDFLADSAGIPSASSLWFASWNGNAWQSEPSRVDLGNHPVIGAFNHPLG